MDPEFSTSDCFAFFLVVYCRTAAVFSLQGAGDGFHGDGDDSAQMWTSLIFVLHLELPTSIPHGAPKQFYCLLAINSLEF